MARVRGLARAIETGERVFLRRARSDDFPEFLALHKESRRFLSPWGADFKVNDEAACRALFDNWRGSARNTRKVTLIVCSTADGALLGGVSFSEIVRGHFQSSYLGYWVGAPHARQGIMSEAVRLALDHAFGALGLHRVEANIRPDNPASLALARRIGFRKEGLSPRYLKQKGRWRDHERWTVLSEDWRRPRRAGKAPLRRKA